MMTGWRSTQPCCSPWQRYAILTSRSSTDCVLLYCSCCIWYFGHVLSWLGTFTRVVYDASDACLAMLALSYHFRLIARQQQRSIQASASECNICPPHSDRPARHALVAISGTMWHTHTKHAQCMHEEHKATGLGRATCHALVFGNS